MNTGTAERRDSFRRRTLMAGTLRFKTRRSVLSCVIRNLSVSGARLEISGAHWVPDRFELDIPHQDIRVEARAMWRSSEQMGIAFLRVNGEPFRSARMEDKVNALEAERELLKLRVRQLSEEI